MTFISVTGITDFSPVQAVIGVPQELTAKVQPTNQAGVSIATNQTIIWSFTDSESAAKGTIEQQGNRYFLTAHTPGAIRVRATIHNGVQV